MSSVPPKADANRFTFTGEVTRLHKAVAPGYAPSRPLGGWLATYGKVAQDGTVIPTVDREGHLFEAARTMGGIDFSEFRKRGLWNDTHHFNGQAYVGVSTVLEHHDPTTELAKAHGKVGWWNEGHLWDRNDPRSWTDFTDYVPTPEDLNRADYYWGAATLLKGVPRNLGMSAHGKMLLSPCGHRIIWAAVTENAICELPQNPDATVQPLMLAVPVEPGMLGRPDCADCACPPNLRCPPLSKSVTTATTATIAAAVPQDLEGANRDDHEARLDEQLVRRIMALYGTSESDARRWVARARARLRQVRERAQTRLQPERSLYG